MLILSCSRRAGLLGLLLFVSFSLHTAQGGSATWDLNPTTGDWNTAANWMPATVPNGEADTATFAVSNTTAVSIPTTVEINGIVFNPSGSAFTITPSVSLGLIISGTGITNNSGLVQKFATIQIRS
jgi:hypothetical protein